MSTDIPNVIWNTDEMVKHFVYTLNVCTRITILRQPYKLKNVWETDDICSRISTEAATHVYLETERPKHERT